MPLIESGDNRRQHVLPFLIESQATAPKEEGIPNYMDPTSVMDNLVSPVSISIIKDGQTYQSEGAYKNYEPIIEMPASPELKSIEIEEKDVEDLWYDDYDEIPTIRLDEEFGAGVQDYPYVDPTIQESHASQALVCVPTSTPARKLKNIRRLRTEHDV